MPSIKQPDVELLKLLGALLLCGFAGLEGQEAAAGEGIILLPELPVGAFLGIYLLQREVLPRDVQVVPVGLLYVSQPNCCNTDVGSEVVVEDRKVNLFTHIAPPFQLRLR